VAFTATMITSVKLFIGISNLRSNYSCLTRTVSSNILSVKFGWKIIAVFCMYFIIAVNIWIDIKIVILHHDGTPFVVLGHASVLYLQYVQGSALCPGSIPGAPLHLLK
jgi:hypothetical protein